MGLSFEWWEGFLIGSMLTGTIIVIYGLVQLHWLKPTRVDDDDFDFDKPLSLAAAPVLGPATSMDTPMIRAVYAVRSDTGLYIDPHGRWTEKADEAHTFKSSDRAHKVAALVEGATVTLLFVPASRAK